MYGNTEWSSYEEELREKRRRQTRKILHAYKTDALSGNVRVENTSDDCSNSESLQRHNSKQRKHFLEINVSFYISVLACCPGIDISLGELLMN